MLSMADAVPPAAHESIAPLPCIGIVILNWNGWRETIACLQSLQQLDYPDFRIYVVDNASTDGSEAQLRAFVPTLAVIQAGRNLGWAGGCNIGIRAALHDGCEHVYLLNNDACVRPDTLRPLVEAASLPGAAALGSMVVAEGDHNWAEFAGTVLDDRTHHPRQVSRRIDPVLKQQDPTETIAVKGCSMLLTGTALRQTGLLAEDYFLNYDETDWCFRAAKAGFHNYFVARSVILHKGAVSFSGTASPLYRYFVTRNRILFAQRHLDARGRIFAWRSALWELRQAISPHRRLGAGAGRNTICLFIAVILAIRDALLRRKGDCPAIVRRMTRANRPS